MDNKTRNFNSVLIYKVRLYPDLFVLQGGFNKFSQNHQDYCDGEYLPMNSDLYADECQQHITELNYNWKKLMTNEQCRFTRQRFPK